MSAIKSKFQFIAPHYSRDFELRQARIKLLRKQQDSERSKDQLETRVSMTVSANTGKTEQLHYSRRSFGNAPISSGKYHCQVNTIL